MSFITTTCETCGEVEVPTARLVLRVGSVADAGECVARCPRCADVICRPVNASMAAMLIAVGVHVSRWAPVAVGGLDAAPLTHDDLARFSDQLDQAPAHLDELMRW